MPSGGRALSRTAEDARGAGASGVYLDWAATAPPSRETVDCLQETSREIFGNPSSIHRWGGQARALLEESRRIVAEELDCDSGLVRFTSGGTEANNMALLSLLRRPKPAHLVMSALEHASVHEPGRILEKFGWRVSRVRRGASGLVGAAEIGKALRPDTALVAVMLVNNETGQIQPLEEISGMLRERERSGGPRIHLHVDAVQGAGKIPFSVRGLGADSLSVSAHKFQGPRGVGILVAGGGLEPLHTGGGQEYGLRPGTENTPGIAAAGRALAAACRNREANLRHAGNLAAALMDGVRSCRQCRILPEDRLRRPGAFSPYIVSLAFPPIPGEVLVRVMDDRGYGISTGSACSSRKTGDTRVLEGSGVSREDAFSSVRVSFGPDTTEKNVLDFVHDLRREVELLFKVAR